MGGPETQLEFPRPAGPARVRVVILAWRLRDELMTSVEAVARAARRVPTELVIVLNGAEPEVATAVRTRLRGVSIVELAENVGFGGGCNAGAHGSETEFIAFVNDDAFLDEAWIEQTVAAADRGGRELGAVGGLVLNPEGEVSEAGCRVLESAATVQFAAGTSVADADALGLFTERLVDYCSGAALLVRRAAFEAVGGFDRTFDPAYFEDVDLCFALRASGWEVAFTPGAVARHVGGASTAGDPLYRRFASERSGSRFLERWSSVLATAPSASAPPEARCGIPIDSAPTRHSSISPAGEPDATQVALETMRAYVAWLTEQLRRETQQRALEREALLAAAEAERVAAAQAAAVRIHALERWTPRGLARAVGNRTRRALRLLT